MGLSTSQKQRLQGDSFHTMKLTVDNSKFSSGSDMKKYIRDVMSQLGPQSDTRRVYFTLVITNLIIGITMKFLSAAHTFHTIPDIQLIDLDRTEEFS